MLAQRYWASSSSRVDEQIGDLIHGGCLTRAVRLGTLAPNGEQDGVRGLRLLDFSYRILHFSS